jgi:peptide deformylase
MAIRNIIKKGDETLKKHSKEVKEINSRILDLLDDLRDTLYDQGNGVGLAAPQVGILKRVIVIDVGDGPVALINPEIISGEGEQIDEEGCLSIPGKGGSVLRPYKVKVKALNEKGEEVMVEGEELFARALCHEIDHLEGVLFVDKIIESEE